MLYKYFKGELTNPSENNDIDQALQDKFHQQVSLVDEQMDALAFNKALQSIWELVSAANKYIDDSAPWALSKDESQTKRLGTVMYNLLEAVRLIGLFISPFMPGTGENICKILGIDPASQHFEKHSRWGFLQPGTTIKKAAPLFPRIETE
jgi:methionyl-tRNA synthetase